VRKSSGDDTAVRDPFSDCDLNHNTVVASFDMLERKVRRPPGLHEAFLAAYDRLCLAAASEECVVAVVAVDHRGKVVAAAGLEDRTALIIGRHTQCSFRLPAPEVSLRHLAAHVCVEGGSAVTRLWDLRSGQHFTTEDGVASAAAVAEGPLFVTVNEYALLFVPREALLAAGPGVDAETAWQRLPPREFIERRDVKGELEDRHLPRERRESSRRRNPGRSTITHMHPPTMLGLEPLIGVPWAEILVSDKNVSQRYEVSVEQLTRGVLFGRSDRCLVGSEENMISRVHVLLVRVGGEVWAIDTASTNGTRRAGMDVEAVVLNDHDVLELPGETVLGFRRLAYAGA